VCSSRQKKNSQKYGAKGAAGLVLRFCCFLRRLLSLERAFATCSYSCYCCTGREHLSEISEDLKLAVRDGTRSTRASPFRHGRRACTAPDHAVQIFRGRWRTVCAMCSDRQKAPASLFRGGAGPAVAWTWEKGCSQAPRPRLRNTGRALPLDSRICSSSSEAASGGGTVCCVVLRGRDVT